MTDDRDSDLATSIATRLLQPGALEPITRALALIESDETLRDDVEYARDELLAELELLALPANVDA